MGVIIAGMAGRIARWIFKAAGLQRFDRVLGGVVELARGIAIAAVVGMSLVAFSPGVNLVTQSGLGHYFLVFGYGASWLAPSELRGRLKQEMGKVNPPVAEEESRGGAPKTSGN